VKGALSCDPLLTHNVYVVELHPAVLRFEPFLAGNPGYRKGMPCVYVGTTRLTPAERSANHVTGVSAEGVVQRFGLRLLPFLYAYANPLPFEAAREMETEIVDSLREEGYGVWQTASHVE